MQSFVELWVYLSATPLFGLTATLVTYVLAQALYARVGFAPWANPVLWTVLTLALLLAASGTPYPTYFSGAQFIHFLLGPAVVALAWPLWQRRAELRARARAVLLAAAAGGLAAAAAAVGLGWLLGLPDAVLRSLAPKSVTAPVAMGIAEQLGGIPALAAAFAVITGLTGAISAKYLFDALRIAEPEVRGFALGTAAHGIGAARALQVHPDAGAYAGLALGVQVVLAALLMPLLARLI
ncbi:MAG: LrgB family protein [Piscinibacter sp.]|uniref:LrgB family protein n=1 Tax=Piscinibacter sp. TaxID=1903157 RepID=UPI001B5F86AC|nr:LrgB family protein [Piscinibacter sp.]MBP5990952.1 LrgB family protein [Piscinibacter sp.]MBP6028410.1 LrgB family protein [Piscinibacter sp.]